MATPVLSGTPSLISDCELITNWTMNSGAIDNELYKEGSGSVFGTFKASGNNDAYYDDGATTWDLTSTHLRCWFMFTGAFSKLNTLALGGIQLYVSDGTNTGYWYVSGSDKYLGGWTVLMVDTALDVDSGTKPNMAVVSRVGIRVNLTATLRNVDNAWIDNLTYGDGYVITGGSDVDKITWQDIADTDALTTEGWGVVQKINGVYFVNGKLTFGDAAGTGSCYFEDTGETIVYLDEQVAADLYEILVVGNGTGTTKFQLGAKSGSHGIQGGAVKAPTGQSFDITATDTDITDFKLYGCVFTGADSVQLPVTSSNREVLDCSFSDCGEVLASTCKVQYCTFITPTSRAARMSSTSHNISDCSFINCPDGVHIPSAGTYGFSNMLFSGCTFDVENSAAATQVDSYPDTNRDAAVQLYSGAITRIAQSFVATAGDLSRAIFSLQKVSAPTGNVVAKLYSDSGGSGPDALLATSEDVDITGIGTSWAQVDFEFEDEFTLVVATTYWIVVEYSGGDSSNRLEVGVDNSTPTHSGSCYTYSGSWSSQTYDMCFYVNRDGIVTVSATGTSNPGSAEETDTLKGATIISNDVVLTVTCKNTAGLAIEGVRVRVETTGGVLITEGNTNSSGIFTDNYNYGGAIDVNVVARLKGYVNNGASSDIGSSGMSVPFTMVRDQAVNLP